MAKSNPGGGVLASLTRPLRAAGRTAVFFLKVFPMLPSRPVDWVTPRPVIEKVRYPTCTGEAEGDLYHPAGQGPFPGIVVCLGVVPFEVDHPQVPVLGRALARAGFAALLYWSPSMRDFRLDPSDVENISLAAEWLFDQPYVDASRSGLLGTCVGGSFALMAAAAPCVRDRAAFASAYAPFSSMNVLAVDAASGSCDNGEGRQAWKVDQLTRRVYVHSLTAWLEPGEAQRLRAAFPAPGSSPDDGLGLRAAFPAPGSSPDDGLGLRAAFPAPGSSPDDGLGLRAAFAAPGSSPDDGLGLSEPGRRIYELLSAPDADAARAALERLPADLRARLNLMSPLNHLENLHAPMIALLHDRGDQVIPVGESRRLVAALAGRAGVRFTEMNFSHLDPSKGRLPLTHLLREFAKFISAVYPIFRCTTS